MSNKESGRRLVAIPGQDSSRKLVAILSADVVDYSRLMGNDEAGTVQVVTTHFQVVSELVDQFGGRVIDNVGDRLLAAFRSVVDAVHCALEVQRQITSRSEGVPEGRRLRFRIGINLGDVIEKDDKLYGDGVNVAARIEELAEPGAVCISGTAYDQVKNKIAVGYEDLGEQQVKNIQDPVRVYRIVPGPEGASVQKPGRDSSRRSRNMFLAIAGAMVALFAVVWHFSVHHWQKSAGSAHESSPTPSLPSGPSLAVVHFDNMTGTPRRKSTGSAPESSPTLSLPSQPSLAVLHFENMTGNPDQEYLTDGLTDDVTTTLSRLPKLFIIGRESMKGYKGKATDVRAISRELGVRYLLEGSVQRVGPRLRINCRLIDGTTGEQVWAERYERDEEEFLEARDAIILDLATELEGELTDGEFAMIIRRRINSLAAWEAVQRGYDYYDRYTVEDAILSREWFRKAADLEPESTVGWMGMAWATFKEGRARMGPEGKELYRKAAEMAEKVRRMDPSYFGPYMLLAMLQLREGRYDEALANARKAHELEPTFINCTSVLATVLIYVGKPEAEEAIGLMKWVMRKNPNFRSWYPFGLGKAYHMAGQTDKAIEWYKISVKKEPKYVDARVNLAAAYAEQGREDEMRSEAAEILSLKPAFTVRSFTETASLPKDSKLRQHQVDMLLKAGLPK